MQHLLAQTRLISVAFFQSTIFIDVGIILHLVLCIYFVFYVAAVVHVLDIVSWRLYDNAIQSAIQLNNKAYSLPPNLAALNTKNAI